MTNRTANNSVGSVEVEMRKYTNVFVADSFSVKSQFKKPKTLEEAREHGRKEQEEKGYLRYVGIMGIDVTAKQLNAWKRKEHDFEA